MAESKARSAETGMPDDDGPTGELAIRTIAMPSDQNASGDIFGGWVLSQMDIAGGILAGRRARGRTATVAVDAMTFHLPVHVGDVVNCYSRIERVGRTSLTVAVEVWAERRNTKEVVKVTEGLFTFVALGKDRRPRPVDG